MNRLMILSIVVATLSVAALGQKVSTFYTGGEDEAWLGVLVRDVTTKTIEEKKLKTKSGALVSEVIEESPAEEAGLREGDVIVRFDDRAVEDSDDLVRAVGRSDAGDQVKIELDRGGKSMTLTAKLEKTHEGNRFAFRLSAQPRIAPMPRTPRGLEFFGRQDLSGIRMQDLGKQLAEYFEVPGNRGVLVTSVNRKSPAEKSGVKAGDVIVRVNGNTVLDADDCFDEIRDADRDEVRLELIRRGKPLSLTLQVEPSGRRHGGLFFELEDGHARLRDELRALKEQLPNDREALGGLRETLRELKEDLRDNLHEIFDQHLPNLRTAARVVFLSI